MRSSFQAILVSAAALGALAPAAAHAQAAPADQSSRQALVRFEVEATDAEAKAEAAKARADNTKLFLDSADKRQVPGIPASAAFNTYREELTKQLDQETRDADAAALVATTLRKKADVARLMLADMDHRDGSNRTATGEKISLFPFSADMRTVFTDPNPYLNPPKKPKEKETEPVFAEDHTTAGQTSETSHASGSTSRAIGGSVYARIVPVLLDRPSNKGMGGVQLSMTDKDSKITFKFSRPRLGKTLYRGGPANEVTGDRPFLSAWSASLSATSDDGFANLKEGFKAAEFSGSIGFSRVFYRRRSVQDMKKSLWKAESKIAEACKADKIASIAPISSDMLALPCTGEKLHDWTIEREDNGTRTHSKQYEILQKAVWGADTPPVWDVGGEVSAGFKNYEFRDLGAIPLLLDATDPYGVKKQTFQPLIWSANAYVGKILRSYEDEPLLYGSLLGEVGREYDLAKGKKDQTICPPAAPGALNTVCGTSNIAPPVRNNFYRVGMEFNARVPGFWLIPDLGFSPKVTYDVSDGQLAYSFPLTFTGDEAGKLNAGIQIKGEHGGKNPDPFAVGFFVGIPFSVGHGD